MTAMLAQILLQIVVVTSMFAAQYGVVYAFCRLKFSKNPASDLQSWREETESTRRLLRAFGAAAVAFAFLTSLIGSRSWEWPFLASLWVLSIFLVIDYAIGRRLKYQQ